MAPFWRPSSWSIHPGGWPTMSLGKPEPPLPCPKQSPHLHPYVPWLPWLPSLPPLSTWYPCSPCWDTQWTVVHEPSSGFLMCHPGSTSIASAGVVSWLEFAVWSTPCKSCKQSATQVTPWPPHVSVGNERGSIYNYTFQAQAQMPNDAIWSKWCPVTQSLVFLYLLPNHQHTREQGWHVTGKEFFIWLNPNISNVFHKVNRVLCVGLHSLANQGR